MRIFIIIFVISVFLLTGCVNLDEFVPVEEYNCRVAELEEANSETGAKSVEILELREEVNILENDLDLSKEEAEKYQNLINNLNELLSFVYYGYASNEQWILDGFTAFSIFYNEKYYLLTAGHCVEYEDVGRMTDFKFKANFSDQWIYPKLLFYQNDFYGKNDYAIFYSDKIDNGLNVDYDNDYPQFLLGAINNDLNVLRENKNWGEDGECGSPVIDLDGEVIGVFIGYTTPIEVVLRAIDDLE